MSSFDAGNFGSFLSGIGTLALVVIALAWACQRRAEKKSDIAEFALDNLYVFEEEIKNWLSFATSWIVYSRNSEENIKKLNSLSGKAKEEFIENLNKDEHEVSNHCKSGVKIIKILKTIKYRVIRLSDPLIDKKFKHLNEYAQQLPSKLAAVHFIPNPVTVKEAAKSYLEGAFEIIEKDCANIHNLLVNYLMFRQKRFHRLRKWIAKLRKKEV